MGLPLATSGYSGSRTYVLFKRLLCNILRLDDTSAILLL